MMLRKEFDSYRSVVIFVFIRFVLFSISPEERHLSQRLSVVVRANPRLSVTVVLTVRTTDDCQYLKVPLDLFTSLGTCVLVATEYLPGPLIGLALSDFPCLPCFFCIFIFFKIFLPTFLLTVLIVYLVPCWQLLCRLCGDFVCLEL